MDTSQKDMTLEESVAQVLQTLPPVVRDFVSQGKYTDVAKRLMSKYGLRIDQAGVLERELMLILMGVDSPDEFTQALADEAKLDQKVINDIVREVNELVFIPLREAEEGKKEEGSLMSPLKPAEVAKEEKPKEIMRLVVPTRPTNAPAPLPTMLPAQKSPSSSELLEDHEEPHIELGKVPVAPPPVPPYVHTIQSKPLPLPTPAPVITSYSTDPYRETVDEPPAA